MEVHLIDGTYELFRHFFALPKAEMRGREVAAVRGVLGSVLGMIQEGATHLAVATDHVIESFRNGLWPDYKTGEGVEPDLLSQIPLLEEALAASGVMVWPMIEFEADDALAAAALKAGGDPRVERVVICSPDKDLSQCVRGTRIVQLDRRRRSMRDEAGVFERFGVGPGSIPDYLALVGDAADGFPGLRGWGAKSAAAVLSRYRHLEQIPVLTRDWNVDLRSARSLGATLRADYDLVLLFRELATLRTDVAVFDDVEQLRWRGPGKDFGRIGTLLDAATGGKTTMRRHT